MQGIFNFESSNIKMSSYALNLAEERNSLIYQIFYTQAHHLQMHSTKQVFLMFKISSSSVSPNVF